MIQVSTDEVMAQCSWGSLSLYNRGAGLLMKFNLDFVQAYLPTPPSLSSLHRYVPIALLPLGQRNLPLPPNVGAYLALFSVGMIGTTSGLYSVIKVGLDLLVFYRGCF